MKKCPKDFLAAAHTVQIPAFRLPNIMNRNGVLSKLVIVDLDRKLQVPLVARASKLARNDEYRHDTTCRAKSDDPRLIN